MSPREHQGALQSRFRAQVRNKTRHQLYLGQDSAHLPPGQCPCSWLSPLGSTLGQGTDPCSHSQTCWGQQVSPCLEKPHLGHPKPISCSEGSCSACSCPAPALCSTPRAGLRLPSPGKSMVVSSSGDSSRLRMDCWKVLLQLDCRWLQNRVQAQGDVVPGPSAHTQGQGSSCTPSTSPCSPNPLLGCSPPRTVNGPRAQRAEQWDRLGQEREQWAAPLSPPAPEMDTAPPSPRGHVLPELVEDEAGLVPQLAGRDTVGTEGP